MSRRSELNDIENGVVPVGVKINDLLLPAGPGHFGRAITGNERIINSMALTKPEDACSAITNIDEVTGKFGIAKRGQCTFIQKAQYMKAAGISLAIIVDNVEGSSHENSPLFAMSDDGQNSVEIPAVFLFHKDAQHLIEAMKRNPEQTVIIGDLQSMKREYDNGCSKGVCKSDNTESLENLESNNKESFEHLKKVLNQLAQQFELSLSNDENSSKASKSCEKKNKLVISKEEGVTNVEEAYVANNKIDMPHENNVIQWKGIVKTESGFKTDVTMVERNQNTSGDL